MPEANLRWKAQTSEAEAQILALKAVIDSIGGGSTSSRIRGTSSELDKLGRDGEKAGGLIRREFDKIPSSLARFGAGLSGPFGILKPLGLLIQAGGLLGKGLQSLGGWMEQLGTDGEQAAGGLLGMLSSMGPLVAAGGPLVAIFVALGGALLVLPVLAAVVTAALVALLDIVTTLSAIVAGFVAPLTLVAGLLGLLGGGFFLAGKRALEGGGQFKQFASEVSGVEKQFKGLIYTLGGVFLPYFEKLVGAAKTALTYFGQLAHMNLGDAFKSLSTHGVHLLNQFVSGVGHAIADPIRLAIKVAFSPSSHMRDAVQGWWDSVRAFLFGAVKQKPFKIGGHQILIGVPQKGALAPLIAWFDRQHFTDTGIKWAHSIVDGITRKGGFWDTIKPFVETVAADAGTAAGHAFAAAFEAELSSIPGAIAGAIVGSPSGASIIGGVVGNTGSGAGPGYGGARGGTRRQLAKGP